MYFPYRVIDFLFLLNIDAFFPAIILGHIVFQKTTAISELFEEAGGSNHYDCPSYVTGQRDADAKGQSESEARKLIT